MNQDVSSEKIEKTKLNQETSQMDWADLQRYFASGVLLSVNSDLDLIDTAYQMSLDNKALFSQWLDRGLVVQVSDLQAAQWHNEQAKLWTVVVRPWVLVQQEPQLANV